MLDEYYHYRGCSKDGLPLRHRLEEAGLVDIADDLEREGKLGKEETDTYLTLETLANPLSREFTAPRTKGDEFSEKIVKDKKLMELASSPGTIDLIGSVIDIKRKLKNFMKSKYGTPTVFCVGALAAVLYYLLHMKKDL